MSFAEELADARKNNNLTQEELAEMLNVSRQTISKWERNEGYPEVETLLEIARRLHLSLDQLMHEELSFVSDFESISTVAAKKCRNKLEKISKETLVKACMVTSPTNAKWIADIFPEIDFEKGFSGIGRIRISEVEDAQKAILAAINDKL
ncbi:MAG: helix-turn-helix transcriptional regulator [Lachnospiraceae bacterium]|nr:helix-turn-helix transcriptional regulator [Lachnospiraceae bacterium]